jgi:hypothetical protein
VEQILAPTSNRFFKGLFFSKAEKFGSEKSPPEPGKRFLPAKVQPRCKIISFEGSCSLQIHSHFKKGGKKEEKKGEKKEENL